MVYSFRQNGPDGSENPWQTLSSREVYDNPWIKVTHNDVINPGGGNGIYGRVHFKNTAIGIVPIDQEGCTWLVGQYRYPLGRYSWEIPEGGGPLEHDLLASAQRELEEETGIKAKVWTPLLELHLSNSVTDEYGVAFVATELSIGQPRPEETEALRLRRLPLQVAVEMALDGEITDALSVAALLKTSVWAEKHNWF